MKIYRAVDEKQEVVLPELERDCEDLDSLMRVSRFAAGTQPSLLLRRLRTNLKKQNKQT